MTGTVLITGASGVVGHGALERFLADDAWEVVTTSRRAPEVPDGTRAFRHVPADLTDEGSVTAAFADLGDVTHVVYTALYEKPGLMAGWLERDQMDTNDRMLRNTIGALEAAGATLQHVSLLQGTKAYGVHVQPIRIPAKESQPRVVHDNFYWLQQDFLTARAAELGFAWTVLRPQFIFGGELGAAMNLVPIIGVYAAICRETGRPFGYPGGASYVAEGVDARLLGDVLVWAATAPGARDEIFNVTNGDVFEWRDLWPSFADALGVDVGPDEPTQLSTWLPEHEADWQRVVDRDGLRQMPFAALLGESHHYTDFAFAYGSDGRRANPAFVSTVKLRRAGFTGVMDTEETFQHYFHDLQARSVLPKP